MKRLIILGALGGALAWLHSIGALDPGLWADTFRREKERIPRELKEALAAGKRAAAMPRRSSTARSARAPASTRGRARPRPRGCGRPAAGATLAGRPTTSASPWRCSSSCSGSMRAP